LTFGVAGARGICGLAFPSLAGGQPTFLDTTFAQHPELGRRFSFFLSRGANEQGSQVRRQISNHRCHLHPDVLSNALHPVPTPTGPQVVFGDVDDSRFTRGNVSANFVPTVSDTYWTVGVQHMAVGNKVLCTDTGSAGELRPACAALIDTGTSFIGVPPAMLADVHATISAGHNCERRNFDGFIYLVCDCTGDGPDGFPPLVIHLQRDGQPLDVSIRASDYMQYTQGLFSSTCIPLVLALPASNMHFAFADSAFLLGMPFLRTVYTVFSYPEDRQAVGSAISFTPSSAPPVNVRAKGQLLAWGFGAAGVAALCGALVAGALRTLTLRRARRNAAAAAAVRQAGWVRVVVAQAAAPPQPPLAAATTSGNAAPAMAAASSEEADARRSFR